MSIFLAALVGLLLSAWFAVTVFCQFPGRSVRDRLALVPRWTFFAPNPGEWDYHLVFRDYDEGASPLMSWTEIDEHVQRSPLNALWNPGKRYRKAVIDCCQLCLPYRNRLEAIRTSVPYLALLNVVMAQPRYDGAGLRRFAIIGTKRFGGFAPEVLITSDLHAL